MKILNCEPQVDRGVLRLASASTAFYAAILDKNGDCKFGIGDFKIHDQLTVDRVTCSVIKRIEFYFETTCFEN